MVKAHYLAILNLPPLLKAFHPNGTPEDGKIEEDSHYPSFLVRPLQSSHPIEILRRRRRRRRKKKTGKAAAIVCHPGRLSTSVPPPPPKHREEDMTEQSPHAQDLLHNQIHYPTSSNSSTPLKSLSPSIRASPTSFSPFLSSASIEDNKKALSDEERALPPHPHRPSPLLVFALATFSSTFAVIESPSSPSPPPSPSSVAILVFAVIPNFVFGCFVAAEPSLSSLLLSPSLSCFSRATSPITGCWDSHRKEREPERKKNLKYCIPF